MSTILRVTIDDGEHVHRYQRDAPQWPSVPRVGDMITPAGGDGYLCAPVDRVRWELDGRVVVDLGLIEHVFLDTSTMIEVGWTHQESNEKVKPYAER